MDACCWKLLVTLQNVLQLLAQEPCTCIALQTQISTAQSRHATFIWPSCAHLHRYTCFSGRRFPAMQMGGTKAWTCCLYATMMLVPFGDYDCDVDLSLQHLIWEEGGAKIGQKPTQQPHYAVVDCSSVIRQACIFPHSRSGMKVKGITFWSMTC